ncbi:autotransporter outer membrane beta-barrel domain-containing protein [Rhizobium sp. S163]|uniref:autotransporter family protein n=1 Tax=Rhizobium sp. S163 TaxID=3055039 RepID=UPI0025A9A9A9|nr:autotransporter outer membrane beta-barrel domain-containing protein [Rhizobium sp. S163]MDM9646766.1 autotransporter outer membrane beta-barrel domain-containing protein [Rhizobium sp. S163]
MGSGFGTRGFVREANRKLGFLSGVSIGALALGFSVHAASAATFFVSTEAQLYQAIADAQASPDASSTITLTSSFSLASPFPTVAAKNITVETSGYILTFSGSSAFNIAAGATLTFSGVAANSASVLTKTGDGTLYLQDTATGITRVTLSDGSTVIAGGANVTYGTSSGGTLAQLDLAGTTGSEASLTISGAGTRVQATGTDANQLSGGVGSVSTFTIQDGARFTSAGGVTLHKTSSLGTATVNVLGAGSTLAAASFASVAGISYINVLDGGVVNITGQTSFGSIGNLGYAGANAMVVVSGDGSEWTTGTTLAMQSGSLSVLDGGVVTATTVNVATTTNAVTPNFNVLVSGDGSELRATTMTVGTRGTGIVTIANDGQVIINGGTSAIVLGGPLASSNASLNIGGVVGAAATAAGTLAASAITLAASAEINFNHTETGYVFDTPINGSGAINQYAGRTIFNADQTGFSGLASIYGGMLEVNGILGGTVETNGGTLGGVGTVGDTTNNSGGSIAPGIIGIGTLTIGGNYTSNGGALLIEAALYDDASPADLLTVTGDTILGTDATRVFVTNLSGYGGETTGDGIKIVDVAGVSASDVFVLGAPAIGGAYRYGLFQNGITDPADGDWYLRTVSLAPTVPVYESYPIVLLGMTDLPTLRQRVGDRYWSEQDDTVGSPDGFTGPRNFWTRIEGAHDHAEGNSTTDMSYDSNRYLVQVGIDGLLEETFKGMLIAGLNVQYGQTHANIASPLGNGENNTDSYSIGATLSWIGSDGSYVDGQAQVAHLSTNLSASEVGKLVDRNDGNGYALSIEAGRKMAIDNNWSIIPQAQFSYNAVNFDSFTDPFNAHVSLDRADTAKGRIGLAVDYDDSAGASRNHVYAIANLTYDFRNGTSVNVSEVNVKFEPEKFGAEFGVGGTYRWADGKYNLYGEALTATRFDGSYGLKGTVGFSTAF